MEGSPTSPGGSGGSAFSRQTQYRKRLSARHTFRIVLRNAIYAALGRIVVGVVKLLAKKGLGRAFFHRLSGEFYSLDPLKWAAVFGGFSAFRFCRQVLSGVGEKVGIPDKLCAFASGCVCAAPALVMNKQTRTELCLYLFVRSFHTFTLRYIVPRLPRPLQNFDHYDVVLMSLSSLQICYGCLFAPYTMPPSYRSFLVRASTYDARLICGHSNFSRDHLDPNMVSYCWQHKEPIFEDFGDAGAASVCAVTHPGYSCSSWLAAFIPNNMLRMGIPLYGPLRVVSVLAFQRKRLLKDPAGTLLHNLRSVLTSSLFLAVYIAVFLRSSCWQVRNHVYGGLAPSVLASAAGLACLLEPKGRRMDLALYCSMYALRSFILTQNRLGHLPHPRHWFVFLVYILSTGFIFYEYEEEPHLLDRRVRSGLGKLLGERSTTSPTTVDRKAEGSSSAASAEERGARRVKISSDLPSNRSRS